MRINVNWRNNPMSNIYGTCEICGRTNAPYESHCESHAFVDSRDYITIPDLPLKEI